MPGSAWRVVEMLDFRAHSIEEDSHLFRQDEQEHRVSEVSHRCEGAKTEEVR